jgi:hypothetical protein
LVRERGKQFATIFNNLFYLFLTWWQKLLRITRVDFFGQFRRFRTEIAFFEIEIVTRVGSIEIGTPRIGSIEIRLRILFRSFEQTCRTCRSDPSSDDAPTFSDCWVFAARFPRNVSAVRFLSSEVGFIKRFFARIKQRNYTEKIMILTQGAFTYKIYS